MASLTGNYYNIVDSAINSKAREAELITAEYLAKSTPFFDDMHFEQGNSPTGYASALRVDLPTAAKVAYYEGVTPSKGKRQLIIFPSMRLKQMAEIDSDLMELNDNSNEFRLQLKKEHIMAMGQAWEEEVIYADGTDPQGITGLATLYSSISTDPTDIGYNFIDCGGTGSDNTSMYWMCWGSGNIHGFYPKGTKAGITKTSYSRRPATAPGGGTYEAEQHFFTFNGGLAVPDWRSCIRFGNIDSSELSDAGESTYDGPALYNKLIEGANKLPTIVKSGGRQFIYCNVGVKTALDKLMINKATLGLSQIKGADGQPQTTFWGVPIKVAEMILNDEATVS